MAAASPLWLCAPFAQAGVVSAGRMMERRVDCSGGGGGGGGGGVGKVESLRRGSER